MGSGPRGQSTHAGNLWSNVKVDRVITPESFVTSRIAPLCIAFSCFRMIVWSPSLLTLSGGSLTILAPFDPLNASLYGWKSCRFKAKNQEVAQVAQPRAAFTLGSR